MSTKTATVLIAAAHPDPHHELKCRLEGAGIRVVTAATSGETLDRFREESPDLALLDHDLEPVSSASLMIALRRAAPQVAVVLLTDAPPRREELIRTTHGLLYYGVLPGEPGALFGPIRDALRAKGLRFSAPAPEAPLVMCVDDDTLQLSALSRTLSRHGYRVRTCESAVRALSSLDDAPPDVAVIDLLMPGTDGMDLVERLQRRSGRKIPVVLLSAINSEASRRAAKDRGVAHYLTKPCPDREVLAAIQSSLAASER